MLQEIRHYGRVTFEYLRISILTVLEYPANLFGWLLSNPVYCWFCNNKVCSCGIWNYTGLGLWTIGSSIWTVYYFSWTVHDFICSGLVHGILCAGRGI